MNVEVVQECEEGMPRVGVYPVQQFLFDLAGPFPTRDVDLSEPGKQVVGEMPAEHRAGQGIHRAAVEVLVVNEAAIESCVAASPVRVGDESSGQVALRAQLLGKRGEPVIEEQTTAGPGSMLLHQSPGHHA